MASGVSEAYDGCFVELASTFSMVCAICLYCICSSGHRGRYRLPDTVVEFPGTINLYKILSQNQYNNC